MAEGNRPGSEALGPAVNSVRKLRPKAFPLATDHETDIKARWSAFDELYEAIRERMREKGFDPDEALTSPNFRVGMVPVPGGGSVTE